MPWFRHSKLFSRREGNRNFGASVRGLPDLVEPKNVDISTKAHWDIANTVSADSGCVTFPVQCWLDLEKLEFRRVDSDSEILLLQLLLSTSLAENSPDFDLVQVTTELILSSEAAATTLPHSSSEEAAAGHNANMFKVFIKGRPSPLQPVAAEKPMGWNFSSSMASNGGGPPTVARWCWRTIGKPVPAMSCSDMHCGVAVQHHKEPILLEHHVMGQVRSNETRPGIEWYNQPYRFYTDKSRQNQQWRITPPRAEREYSESDLHCLDKDVCSKFRPCDSISQDLQSSLRSELPPLREGSGRSSGLCTSQNSGVKNYFYGPNSTIATFEGHSRGQQGTYMAGADNQPLNF